MKYACLIERRSRASRRRSVLGFDRRHGMLNIAQLLLPLNVCLNRQNWRRPIVRAAVTVSDLGDSWRPGKA